MDNTNIIKYIKKNSINFSQNKNWLSLILQKILQSVSSKKMSLSTLQIVDELLKLDPEYLWDAFKGDDPEARLESRFIRGAL